MFDIQNYGSFIMAVVVFQIIPGAGTITILNATARKGVGIGMRTVFGTLAGDFIYMLSAVLGLAAILSAYPGILKSAQWIGVAYLCWLGLKLLRASVTDQSADMALAKGGWVYFRQAFTVSLTNPKVIMFFMAFFPLFLNSESSPVTLLTLRGINPCYKKLNPGTVSGEYVLTGNGVFFLMTSNDDIGPQRT